MIDFEFITEMNVQKVKRISINQKIIYLNI